jgi:hypothetical protein
MDTFARTTSTAARACPPPALRASRPQKGVPRYVCYRRMVVRRGDAKIQCRSHVLEVQNCFGFGSGFYSPWIGGLESRQERRHELPPHQQTVRPRRSALVLGYALFARSINKSVEWLRHPRKLPS